MKKIESTLASLAVKRARTILAAGMAVALGMAAGMVGPAHGAIMEDDAAAVALFASSPEVRPFFDDAYGYAVFPTVGKAGMIVGGSYGKGRVYRGGIPTGVVELVKLSVGFQAGGQAFSQIVFFQDERAYDEFTRGEFEFDAAMSAVAVTAGVQARVGTDGPSASAAAGPGTTGQASVGYTRGMAVFIHVRGGFMAAATVGGQTVRFAPMD